MPARTRSDDGGEIDEAAVHDVVRAGFENQLVQHIHFVHRTGGNIDKTRDIPAKIHQRVQLDALLAVLNCAQGNSFRHRSMVVVSRT